MELPADVLCIIREYAKPCTRPDWKTCKRPEALCIKMCNYEFHYRTFDLFPYNMKELSNEIASWSLYGRIHLLQILRTPRLWHPADTQDWYELTLRYYIDPFF
jgi:hypothetical protein